jgi:anti-anti-sigma regulatory factor
VTKHKVATVVHVEGRLATAGVRLLEELVQDSAGAVSLDLSNLMSADDAGIAVLRTLKGRGVRLTSVSPYIGLLLAEDRGRVKRPPPRHRRPRTR